MSVVTAYTVLLAIAVAAFVFMLALFVETSIWPSLPERSIIPPNEEITLASIGRGVATSALLTPFVFVVMAPIAAIMMPVSQFLVASERSRAIKILCGGAIGACVAIPLLLLVYVVPSGNGHLIADLTFMAMVSGLALPSAAASSSFTWTILVRSETRLPLSRGEGSGR